MKRNICILLIACVLLLAGCTPQTPEQTEPAAVLDMQQIYLSFTPHMPEMISMDDAMLLNYCGVETVDCIQSVAAICSDGLRTDEIWLIEAKDTAAADKIAALAQSRLQAKAEESISYSPEQYAVVQKAQLLRSGNYLALIVSPQVETLSQLFKSAAGI